MRVILLERVENLGEMGEEVTVRGGYARNYLIPRRLAEPATEGARRRLAHLAKRAEAARRAAEERARARAAALEGAGVVVRARATEEGTLYGSVGAREIAGALSAQGHEVKASEVELSAPIRALGEHEVRVHLETGIRVPVRVKVVAFEEAAVAPIAESAPG